MQQEEQRTIWWARASDGSLEPIRDPHKYTREVNGRLYDIQKTPYFFPTDKTEFDRHGSHHTRHHAVLGGTPYPRPEMVEFTLRSEPGVEKKVLDIGCGSGEWAMSIARRFPHVGVIGTSLAPTTISEDAVPNNCWFEVHDVNQGLPHFYDQMDLVHMRQVCGGIRDYAETVRELVKCLKPGGMLILIEGDLEWHQEDQVHLTGIADRKFPAPIQPGKTWLGHNVLEFQKAMATRGSDALQAMQLLDHGLWDHPEMDSESCGVVAAFSPIGPWAQSTNPEEHKQLCSLGAVERKNLLGIRGVIKNVLLEKGIEEHVIEDWLDKAELELQTCDEFRLWFLTRYTWGRKSGTDAPHIPVKGLTYRPIPPHLRGQTAPYDPPESNGKYPLAHYYPTAKDASQWMEWKAMERARLGHDSRPDPVPWKK